jgi:hypothetical protein
MSRVVLEDLPSSTITEGTIKRMHDLVRKAKTDWEFIKFSTWLIKGCPPRDHLCELRNIYYKLRKGVKYVRDPDHVELVQNPWAILERKAGDCDCMSVLVAAAASSLGMRYAFKTIKADPARPEQYSHVYPVILIPRVGWVPADLTLRKPILGWEPKGFPSKVWKEPKI